MNRWMILPFLAYDVVSSSSSISAYGSLVDLVAALLTDMSSEARTINRLISWLNFYLWTCRSVGR